jgi:predicted methyltransferase
MNGDSRGSTSLTALSDESKGRRFRFSASGLILLAGLAGLSPLRAQKNPEAGWEKRDTWQQPERVMDALGVTRGSRVADVGCGRGYFTARLAERVGPEGKVYAEDVRDDVLKAVADYAGEKKLTQVITIQGSEDDPSLPPGSLDAILIVNAYHEMKHFDSMLQGMAKALKPGGLLGIIDHYNAPGRPRSEYQKEHKIPPELVREDVLRNGFEFVSEEKGFDRPEGEGGGHFFFLIFRKPR